MIQSIYFDRETGKAPESQAKPLQRYLADMTNMFAHSNIAQRLAMTENPLVYEFYDLHIPQKDTNLSFGTSIVYPGTVGNEFFMTKGHYHCILDTAEVYYCLAGRGLMLMENKEGDVRYEQMSEGVAVYVPGGYAHRSINISLDETLVTFFVFRADAGHDYGTIEERGFRKLVISDGSGFAVVDNPRWQKG